MQHGSPTDQEHWCLTADDILADLSHAEIRALASAAPSRTYPAGALILSPHAPAEALFLLKRGRVRIFRVARDGRALTTALLAPGTIFGEMVMVGQQMHDSFVEALDDVTACVMRPVDVERLLLTDSRIAARMMQQLGRRLADLEQKLADTVLKSVPQRIAGALRTMATGSDDGGIRRMHVLLTHEQLAALVGTSRETTTKVLGEFAEQGLVRLARRRITIVDASSLSALS